VKLIKLLTNPTVGRLKSFHYRKFYFETGICLLKHLQIGILPATRGCPKPTFTFSGITYTCRDASLHDVTDNTRKCCINVLHLDNVYIHLSLVIWIYYLLILVKIPYNMVGRYHRQCRRIFRDVITLNIETPGNSKAFGPTYQAVRCRNTEHNTCRDTTKRGVIALHPAIDCTHNIRQ
jgi:hypothetical protein